MISNRHEHQLGVVLETCRNHVAEEQGVALLGAREDAELGLSERAKFAPHVDWTDPMQCR